MNRPGNTKETGKEQPRTVAKKTTWTDTKNKDRDLRPEKYHVKRKPARRRGEPPKEPTDEKTTNPNPNIALTLENAKRIGQLPCKGKEKSSITAQLTRIGKKKKNIKVQRWNIFLLSLGYSQDRRQLEHNYAH